MSQRVSKLRNKGKKVNNENVRIAVRNAELAGLARCRHDANLFKQMGIGRGIYTRMLGGSRAALEWWAPKALHDLALVMDGMRISSKVKQRELKRYLADPNYSSPIFDVVLGRYTELQLKNDPVSPPIAAQEFDDDDDEGEWTWPSPLASHKKNTKH